MLRHASKTACLCWLLFSICSLMAGSLFAQEQDKSTTVTGDVIVSGDIASFADSQLEIKLWVYDPLLADAGAKLVDEYSDDKFAHTLGTETKHKFTIGAKGTAIKKNRGYYVTVFVLKDGQRTHMGKCQHAGFLCKVLTNEQPRVINVALRAVGSR